MAMRPIGMDSFIQVKVKKKMIGLRIEEKL